MTSRRKLLRRALAGGVALASAVRPRPAAAAAPAAEPLMAMLYDATLCIGCKACVAACGAANDPEAWQGSLHQAPVDLDARTRSVIRLARVGDAPAFVKRQCMHCLDPACVAACMMKALQKREFGLVSWDGGKCVGCRYCQVACPYNVPRFEWDSANPRIVKCELCRDRLVAGGQPACCEACPRAAVIYGRRDDLLAEAHRRIRESPGRYVPRVYGEREAGGTQVLYLSHVPFETLGLPSLGPRSLPESVHAVQGRIYRGFVAPTALYAVVAGLILRNRRAGERDAAPPGTGDVPSREEP
jgi:Fe-S-cluster-containing dehydrogenase component